MVKNDFKYEFRKEEFLCPKLIDKILDDLAFPMKKLEFLFRYIYNNTSKNRFALNYGTAKARIQNQLSYKLGLAVMLNSKSLFGYIRMPFTIWRIARKHQKELKAYQRKLVKIFF